MKKIFITLIILITLLAGCEDTSTVLINSDQGRFVNLNIGYKIDGATYIIIEDTQTNLLYLSSDSDYRMDLCTFMNSNDKQYTKEIFMKECNMNIQ